MIVELLYTSAPQGLKQGSRGFCTVLCTAGLPINLAQRLEALSAYRHLYQPGDPRDSANPVCHSHVKFSVGGRTISVISRIAAYGLDYSQRTNKLAHHLVFDDALPRCGPGAVLEQPIVRTQWDGQCITLPAGPRVNDLPENAAVCERWKRLTGDAGWAGVVANAWIKPSPKPTWIIFSENQSDQLLGLMREAIAILPDKMRWKATFSTYCTNLPPDVDCKVRCVVAGSDEARMSIARGDVIDLTKKLGAPAESPAVVAARLGQALGDPQQKAVAKPEPVRPIPASSIGATANNAAVDIEEYELQPEDLVALPPTAPKKLPPRPLVAPKHLKAPKPAGPSAKPISPVWFVGGACAFIAMLLLAVTVFLLTRPKPQTDTVAQNNSDQQATDMPNEVSPNPPLPLEPEASPNLKPLEPVPPVATPKLICTPSEQTVALRDLKSTILATLSLQGPQSKSFDAKKLKVRREGQELSAIEFGQDGAMAWRGENPAMQADDATYDLEIVYDLGESTVVAPFKLRLKAGENPDLQFKIVTQPESIMQAPYALGTLLKPQLTQAEDADEKEPGKNRKWVWERSDRDSDKWTQVHEKDSYTITLDDLSKRLRLKLNYPTRNNEGATEVISDAVEVMAPNRAELSLEKVIAGALRAENVSVRVEPPKITEVSPTMSYGENNTAITKGMFSLPLEKLLVKSDVELLEKELESLVVANAKYEESLAQFKGSTTNLVAQVLRNELFLSRADALSVDAKCTFAQQRQKLEEFIPKILRLEAINTNKDKDGKFKKELEKFQETYIDSANGYPHDASFQPMQLKIPEERLRAIFDFVNHWKSVGQPAWNKLAESEQAFFSALQSVLTKRLPLVRSHGKLAVKRAAASADNNPLLGAKVQKLLEYEMAVQFNIAVSPELRKKIEGAIVKPAEVAADTTAAPPASKDAQ